jgi:ferritin-like metal-binding protein YciE
MNIQSLDDLFVYELQQLHLAERVFLDALPKLTRKDDKHDADAITQAQGRIQRLEQIFTMIDHKPRGGICWAMGGILTDADCLLGIENSDARDSAKEAAVQTCRRYLVARYTLLVALANRLGKSVVEKLLRATLDAEAVLDKGESRPSYIGDRLTALLDRKT